MKKKIISGTILLMLGISLILPTGKSFAAGPSVTVTLPKFVVNLNGNIVENRNRQYPLLVYKDITYFPMTWYDSRLLGLEAKWTQSGGLKITKENVTSAYVPYQTNRQNPTSFKATISNNSFTLNGKLIKNSEEVYPLLSYNSVAYFPLTWKYAHEAFGWDYQWSSTKGLAINSSNPQVKTMNLPSITDETNVAVYKGYYYFAESSGNSNQINRVPVNNTSNKQLVYSYNTDDLSSKYVSFHVRENGLWFTYHFGGAVMGHDVYGKVNDNGKAIIEHIGYLDFKKSPTGTLTIDHSVPPNLNNLFLIPTGQEAKNNNDFSHIGKSVGDPTLIYDWHLPFDGSSTTSFNNESSTSIIGNDVYVLASSYPVESEDLNNIYKINLTTNQTEKIINSNVNGFRATKNKLYYVKDADHALYSANLDGTNEQKLSENKGANRYLEIEGIIYYLVANSQGQLQLYKLESAKEDTLILKESISNIQLVNDKLICQLASGEDYGIEVLDKSGNLILAITDKASTIFAYNDSIVMASAKDKSIKVVNITP